MHTIKDCVTKNVQFALTGGRRLAGDGFLANATSLVVAISPAKRLFQEVPTGYMRGASKGMFLPHLAKIKIFNEGIGNYQPSGGKMERVLIRQVLLTALTLLAWPVSTASAGGLLGDLLKNVPSGATIIEKYQSDRVDILDHIKSAAPPDNRTVPHDNFATQGDASVLNEVTRKLSAPYFFAPWAAALSSDALTSIGVPASSSFFCGATLLSSEWALTTLFCVAKLDPSDLRLLYGAAHLDDARTVAISQVVPHSGSASPDSLHGLALLHLAAPIDDPSIVFPQIYRDPPELLIADPATRVYGWGSITELGEVSEDLIQIDTQIVAQSECNSPTAYAGRVSPSEFCARSRIPDADTCLGFAGSGLISSQRSLPELVGLVSWGEGCGRQGKPTVYVNTAHYEEWIYSVVHSGIKR